MRLKYLILCFLFFPYFLFAGDSLNDNKEFMSPRNAVVEIFTNTGSVFGAITYGVLNDYIRKNPDGIIPIVYHTYSPFSNDPFYQMNKEMNLNRWGHYSKLFDMSLDNSASVGGHYFAQNRENMDSIVRAINWQKGIVVPLKMSINMVKDADSAEITVHLQSVSNFGKRTVFIYLMDSYYTSYGIHKYWDDEALTPNKEVYFRWIPRAMVPDENGLEVKLMEGTDTTLKVKVPIKCTGFMSNKKLYATAVLQSPTSTNLIQAVTTYNPMRAKAQFQGREIQTGDSSYIKIKREEKNFFSFTLENPYNYEVTYKVNLYARAKLFYVSLIRYDDTLYTLQPYEKREIRFLVVSQNYADFARMDIVARPVNVPDPKLQEDALFFSVFAITENLQCATLHTYPKLEDDAEAIDNLVSDGAEDWAVCPYDVFMKGYSDMSVKLFYLMLDTRNIPTFGLNLQRVNFLLSLIEKGRGIIISSVFELAMAQNAYRDYNYVTQPEMRTFLSDKLGISLGNHFNIKDKPVNVFGIPGSDFGKDVTIENTKINDIWTITKTKDAESIKLNGKNLRTKGFLRYDIAETPEDEFAGVTSEVGKARLAYFGFGLENSAYYGKRNILDNTMWWLMHGARPKRACLVVSPSDTIKFETREIYTSTSRLVHFTNTGDTALHITDITIEKFGESFIFDTSAIARTLEPAQSFDLPLVFEPKKRQNMVTWLEISSDAYYGGNPSRLLIGRGVMTDKGIIKPDEATDDWLDISSKLRSDNVNIKFEPNNKAKIIKITLIDGDGNRFNIPYEPKGKSAMQSFSFNKKLFEHEKYELLLEIDGKVIRKFINDYEGK